MALEIQILRCSDDAHVTNQTTARIPARVIWLTGIAGYLDKVVLAIFQHVGNVYLVANIAVIVAPNALQVQKNI